jgi:mannose/fructose/N-acetylgalactosamine-specific phosphotransferase system component IIB
MGVPPQMDLFFASVDDAPGQLGAWRADQRAGILLTGDIQSMARLVSSADGITAVNLGGVHHRAGRIERLRYIYLSPAEAQVLRDLEARGVAVTARDVPSARPVPLRELLDSGAKA